MYSKSLGLGIGEKLSFEDCIVYNFWTTGTFAFLISLTCFIFSIFVARRRSFILFRWLTRLYLFLKNLFTYSFPKLWLKIDRFHGV